MEGYICQNCGTDWAEASLLPINDVFERVQPGDTMPDGECPECGGVCFADETPEEQTAERVRRAAPDLLAVLEEFVEDVETSYQHGDEFPDGDALEMLRVEWPDLAITYEKAVKAIAKAKGDQ